MTLKALTCKNGSLVYIDYNWLCCSWKSGQFSPDYSVGTEQMHCFSTILFLLYLSKGFKLVLLLSSEYDFMQASVLLHKYRM